MEVHHHPKVDSHLHEKNFKEYFLEFLMIFLAVTLGFYCRKYKGAYMLITRKRKLIWKMLLEDLKADTAIYNNYTKNNQVLFESIDTLIKLIKSPDRKQSCR